MNGPEGVKDYGPVFSSAELHRCPGELMEQVAELKNQFPGSKMVSGDVNMQWLEELSTHPDDIPVKQDAPPQRELRRKTAAAVEAMKKMGAKP